MRIPTASLILVFVAGSLDYRQRQEFRGATDVVQVAVAVERKNTPVVGLKSADFELKDNGVLQITDLESMDDLPIDISVVFDHGYLAQRASQRFASDLQEIASTLRSTDRLRVIVAATEVTEVGPLDAPQSWITTRVDMIRHLGPIDEMDRDLLHDPRFRYHSLFDALVFAMSPPVDVGRRHLIVAFSPCVDVGSVVMNGNQVNAVAERTDAVLYVACSTIQPQVLGPGAAYTRLALRAASFATGGEVRNLADSVKTFKTLLEAFRRGYVLTYTLRDVPSAGRHTISIKTPAHPDYTVRARSGYQGR